MDCSDPGTLNTLFLWSWGPNQIPLPHWASGLPLWVHIPLVYTIMFLCLLFWWSYLSLCARSLEMLYGLAKILMHLDRLSLLIIIGSKVILPLVCLARSFTVLCWFISNRLSCTGLGPIRLLFGGIAVSLSSCLSCSLLCVGTLFCCL